MAGRPLRPATDRRLGGPLPHQPANQTRAHRIPPEIFTLGHASPCAHAVLAPISKCYPLYTAGCPRVTHPSATRMGITRFHPIPVRLACVKHAASVHPEPGSNSRILLPSDLLTAFGPEQAWLLPYPFLLSFLFRSLNLLLNFQGCITVRLSRCWKAGPPKRPPPLRSLPRSLPSIASYPCGRINTQR